MAEVRTFQQTHPWITFRLDLRQATYSLWMLLGEAKSKCEHIAGAPLLPGVAEELYHVYLAKGVMATTAIEGNTLTEEEVRRRLEGKLKLPPSKEYLGQEIDNIIEACNQIGKEVLGGESGDLSVSEIRAFNEQVLKNLSLDEDVEAGEIRRHSVGVGRYKGAPAEDCEFLLAKLCVWLNDEFAVPTMNKTALGILKAIVAHIYIAWIHPFGDGNGRSARLIEFKILLSSGVPAPSAQLLSNHYNETRTEYYRQLDRASKSGGDIFPFIEYALQGFVDGLKGQIELIQGQQYSIHWRNFIHDRFKNKNTKTDVRRRHLAIDLSAHDEEAVTLHDIRYISPRLTEAYSGKTDKTIKRDVNALKEMGLVRQTAKGIHARRERIFGLLPPTVQPA